MATLAVLPVKRFEDAKQRLADHLPPALRSSLAQAMFVDVLDALGHSRIETVIVVTTESAARAIAEDRGALVLADEQSGHSAAATLGVRHALSAGAERVLLVPGDCPGLDPGELDSLLAMEPGAPSVLVVPDRHGTGTNALLLTPPDAIAPSFGPGSCQRHLEIAAARSTHAEVVQVASLAFDVDTPEDLDALLARPAAAPATRALLARC